MAAKKAETKGVVVALTDADARKKALEVALGKIEKDFGKGSVSNIFIFIAISTFNRFDGRRKFPTIAFNRPIPANLLYAFLYLG